MPGAQNEPYETAATRTAIASGHACPSNGITAAMQADMASPIRSGEKALSTPVRQPSE